MRPIRFGLFFPQVGLPFAALRERTQLADRLGYDAIFFVDHMWARGLPALDHLEVWTLLTAMATVTERIRVGALVVCNSYRNPALLAKMASSLDVISNGRLIFGIGAGWMEEEYAAYGYTFPRPRVRSEQLDEALEIVKRLFTQPSATFEGKYYAVREALNNPKPIQQPHPPILIGGAGEKLLLPLVARHADIWNCPNNRARELPRLLDVMREQCVRVQRDPDAIEVSEQCVVILGKDKDDVRRRREKAATTVGKTFDIEDAGFCGTPEQVAEQMRARAAQGVTFFTFLLSDFHAPESLELFAREVIPAVTA
jgi:F420-dependent oxidoreductase-like protein